MKLKSAFMLVCIGLVAGCSHKDNPVAQDHSTGGNLTPLEKSVVASANSFGFRLFSKINAVQTDSNVFISPFSVSMAFGMALNGANGATLDSLKQALGDAGMSMDEINQSYKNISATLTTLDPRVAFRIANSIWYRTGFEVLQKFLDDNKTYFDAEVASLDFSQPSALQTINNWVNTKTNGKIPTILDRIERGVVMYLINAIYFKGAWTYQFDPQYTKDAPFTCGDGSTVSCQLMSQQATFAYYDDSEMQAIDLPYGDRMFSMTVILPRPGTSIDQFAAALTEEQWNTIVSSLDSSKVDLFIPKFKLEYKKTLNDELQALGMTIAFTPSADFSRITPEGGIFISEVKHKTFVEVNEEGTEAAAVTSIEFIRSTAEGPSIPVMRIDRPFIFAIREHQSGTILFIGKIVDPSAQ
jgi:serine protease inhibitor